MKKLLLSAAVVGALFAVNSCTKEEEKSNADYYSDVTYNEADDTLNTYNGKIGVILSSNCAGSGCHNALSKEEGKDFSTYAASKASFDGVLCTVYQDGGCKPMPENAAKLSDADLHDLTCWAKNGFPQ